jgi:S-adenosylmethionine hydrolase
MRSDVVALLTDFGLHDWFVGAMKAVVLSTNPKVSIIDLSHEVPRHNVAAASFALLACYRYLPTQTITAVVVDPGVGTERRILAAESASRLFVAPDNGVLSRMLDREGYDRLVSVENDAYFLTPVSSTFHGRDIFAPVAGHLSLGLDMADLGVEVTAYERLETPSPRIEDDLLVSSVQWIDSFGNLITDCPVEMVDDLEKRWGRHLTISGTEEGRGRNIKIVSSYETVGPGGLLAIRGSSGYLEISVRGRSAAESLGLVVGDRVELGKV